MAKMRVVYPLDENKKTKEFYISQMTVKKFYPNSEIIILPKNKEKLPPHIDVWRKVIKYARENKEPFLYMNDDIYLQKPFDYEKKQLSFSSLSFRLQGIKDKKGEYHRRVFNTLSLIKGLALPDICFDIHQPMVLIPDVLIWLDNHFQMEQNGYLFKTLHGLLTLPDFEQVQLKYHAKIDNRHQLNRNWLYFSSSNKFNDFAYINALLA